ncbi:hypothetical protein BT93_F0007 [Corymbia citriodora subsp. variegata]|nr:hypothetical protein BT93_F0007 [Corymbia citriodora subsp. variegata]
MEVWLCSPFSQLVAKGVMENRLKYAKLKEDLLISPSEFARRKILGFSPCETEAGSDVDGPLRRHQISQEDHPLSLGKASVWNQYFEVHIFSIMWGSLCPSLPYS